MSLSLTSLCAAADAASTRLLPAEEPVAVIPTPPRKTKRATTPVAADVQKDATPAASPAPAQGKALLRIMDAMYPYPPSHILTHAICNS